MLKPNQQEETDMPTTEWMNKYKSVKKQTDLQN